ncbi:MAG: hypothetical protein JXR37_18820, partial [Kiritimatiellae bacterium]|nr:hypothetical protein [Kiritimatiellia bacterium]
MSAVVRAGSTATAPGPVQGASAGRTRPRAGSRGGAKRKKTPGAKKIRNKELPAFTRQLSAMLGA